MNITTTGTVRTWAFARSLSQNHEHHEDWHSLSHHHEHHQHHEHHEDWHSASLGSCKGSASSASRGLAQCKPGRLQRVWSSIMSVTRTGTVRTWAFARRLNQHHQHHEDWKSAGRLQGVWASIISITRTGTVRTWAFARCLGPAS